MTCFLLFNLLFILNSSGEIQNESAEAPSHSGGENHPDKAPFGLMWHQPWSFVIPVSFK